MEQIASRAGISRAGAYQRPKVRLSFIYAFFFYNSTKTNFGLEPVKPQQHDRPPSLSLNLAGRFPTGAIPYFLNVSQTLQHPR